MLITTIKILKPALLTALMRANDILGEREAVEIIRQLGQGESNTSFYYHLSLQYKNYQTQRHAPDKVFVKLTKPNQPPEFIQREVDFYNKILPALLRKNKIQDLCLTACYDAYFDDITGQSHVILDDVSKDYVPSKEKHPPTQRHREQIIDALARIHAQWWEHPILDTIADMPSEEKIAANLQTYQEKFATLMNFPGSRYMSARHKEILKTVAEKIPPHRKERLINGQGITIVHRDLHPGNLLYSHRDSRIIDWQSWRIDTATDDLAYMMACFWPQHLREFQENNILRRYYNSLLRLGVEGYSWEDLQYDYVASIAHCIGFLLAAWSQDKHVRGYWQRAESALDAFDKLNGMSIFD
ncbi:MAG: aminoglycoside phosphotransferase family protein [Anaerolineae bacterium]|nr:aminoglycoside phosphotransferase family protein [Anaerolineae bacterium]MDQ7033442.1 aminoglycoside phosphotransferase family protein [Anaerolineae bacterium]